MKTLGEIKLEAARRPFETAYWNELFARNWQKTRLTDDGWSGSATERSATVNGPLDATTIAELDRITGGDDLALHIVLTAALASLLHLYTRSDDVVVGQPLLAAGAAVEPLTWTLPVKVAIDGPSALRDVVLSVRDSVQGSIQHQDYPLEILADHLGLIRDGAENPFFDALISLEGLHAEVPADLVKTPMVFQFSRRGGLHLTLHHDPHRVEATTAQRFVRHLQIVLQRLAEDPSTAVRDVVLRGPDDDAWLDTVIRPDVAFDSSVQVHQLFERRAAEQPDAVAVHVADHEYTYGDLDRRANQLARTLRSTGVGPDVVVGVLVERSFEMLVAILATLKAGGAYLPIDPGYPKARIDYLLADSGAPVLLTRGSISADVPDAVVIVDVDDESSYVADGLTLETVGSSTDLCYVIYTSGSTGTPKGAAVEHRSVVNRITWMQRAYPIDVNDVLLQKTPTSFDVSVWELFWWMFEGASVVLPAPGAERDPDALIAAIAENHVTTVHFVPTMLNAFLEYVDAAGLAPRLTSLRQVFASGEALDPHTVRRLHQVLGVPNGTRLVNLYGPTEATVDVSHYPCDDPEVRIVPIGLPIDNLRLYVVDEELRIQPVGVPGELCIAGVGLARGYLNRPELTRERFVEQPFARESRIYRTGDLARWMPDGSVEYLGRIDHQVKVRGFRIEPGEIESALRSHPAVTDAVVVPREHEGQQAVLLGYVVTGDPVGERELIDHLQTTLPEHMVPSRIVVLAAMPLTPNGKLDRSALPDPSSETSTREFSAPSGATEQVLAAIWAEVLGADRVDVRDNFFAIGGDSIHFVIVLAKARAAGLDFSFQEFFQYPTVSDLSAYLADRDSATHAPTGGSMPTEPRVGAFDLIQPQDRALLPADAEDAYPLSMLQAGLIFQSEIMRGTAQYHDIISYLIQSPFDAERFTEAVAALVRRNPMMRTTYHMTGFSEYLQVVHQDAPLPLQIVDLSGLDAGAQQRWYERWVVEEKERQFSWEQPGTLIALYVQILGEGLWRYNISLHNSTLDGWSINLVHAEVFEAYNQMRAGQQLPVVEPDRHMRNYLDLERRSLCSEAAAEFWTGALANRPRTTVPALMPPQTPFSVVISHFDISRELSDRIISLAADLAVPVKNVLLAAHMRVLSVLNGETDVMTGYEHSGRPEAEGADRSIGLFLNTVPFRLVQPGGAWADLIRQVYLSEIDFLPHRRYPMAKIKQDLGTQEPLFDTTFNFTHFYVLKDLKRLPEFNLLDVQVQAETEFILRTEFSRHFFHDNVRLSLHCHADVISPEQVDRIGSYYVRALELMTAEPAGDYTHSLLAPDETALVVEDYSVRPETVAKVGRQGGAVRVYVLDEYGTPAPVGTTGQVVISGPAGAAGPAAEEEADPFRPGSFLQRTGKRGRWTVSGELDMIEVESPVIGQQAQLPHAAFVTPSTPVQRRIAAAWAHVLDIPVEDISVDDDFFEIGGNSLAAMRVVMDLQGLVSLIDLMRHSRLGEIAEIGEANERMGDRRPVSHLRALTPAPEQAECTLVCVPFAAGHASNFLDLADVMAKQAPHIAVKAVELPGHDPMNPDERCVDTRATAAMVVDELLSGVSGPVLLWGHCGGAAVTVEAARLLQERQADLRHVFIGAKLFNPAAVLREAISTVRAMTDQEVIEWLVEQTGFERADGLEPDQVDFISRMFRHDVVAGHTYFLSQRESQNPVKLSVPITFVGAKDDRVIADYRRAYAEWGTLAAGVGLREIETGGHYFARTRAAEVSTLIAEAWSQLRTGTAPVA
jgi:amino acid adenylation domain-containing protein